MSGFCLPRGALRPEMLRHFIAAMGGGSRMGTGLGEEGDRLRETPQRRRKVPSLGKPREQRQSLKSPLQACFSLCPLVQQPKLSSWFCGDVLRLGGGDTNQSRHACSDEDARGPCAVLQQQRTATSVEPLTAELGDKGEPARRRRQRCQRPGTRWWRSRGLERGFD